MMEQMRTCSQMKSGGEFSATPDMWRTARSARNASHRSQRTVRSARHASQSSCTPHQHQQEVMLRSFILRGSSLIPSSPLRPSAVSSSSSLISRYYAANPHPITQPKAASSPAEQHLIHDKITSHGSHDSHAVDSHGNEHHSEHHDADHHHDHHHINHDNGPYGILFGEVCLVTE